MPILDTYTYTSYIIIIIVEIKSPTQKEELRISKRPDHLLVHISWNPGN